MPAGDIGLQSALDGLRIGVEEAVNRSAWNKAGVWFMFHTQSNSDLESPRPRSQGRCS